MLRLVRPRSFALALGLGLVASEVCIPQKKNVLEHTVVVLSGASSLARPHQPLLWCGHHRVLEGTRPMVFWPEADSVDSGEHYRW